MGTVHRCRRGRPWGGAGGHPPLADHRPADLGSSFGGVKGRDGVPALVDRYLAGEIDVDAFISHRITLDEVNRGFDFMHAQDGIRSVIELG